MQLFINSDGGKGFIAKARQSTVSSLNAKYNGATNLVIGNPYRRVYETEAGYWIMLNGKRVSAYVVNN